MIGLPPRAYANHTSPYAVRCALTKQANHQIFRRPEPDGAVTVKRRVRYLGQQTLNCTDTECLSPGSICDSFVKWVYSS